jgi:TPR repeat protein
MGSSALSQSDTVVRPKSLSEGLTAERLAAETPAPPEAMAERFAPSAPRSLNGLSGRGFIEPQRLQDLVPKPPRSINSALLLAFMMVSLVPTAIIVGLLWQGAIRLPITEGTISKSETGPFIKTQQASLAASSQVENEAKSQIETQQDSLAASSQVENEAKPEIETQQASLTAPPQVENEAKLEIETQQASLAAPPQVENEAKPEIALTTEARIEVKTGEDVPFNITIHADTLPARSNIAIHEIPPGATFSEGRPYGSSEWSLTPNELGDLRLHLPKSVTSGTNMRIELMGADGTVLASATTRLDIAQDPRSALILRSDESARVDDLIKHGQKMVEVGYLAGARAYFKRAAEAGSGEAAVLLGATYEPAFIEKMGAQGIKPDLKEARSWYERAKQLGVADTDAKLAELAKEWPNRNSLLEVQERAASSEPAAQTSPPEPVVPADRVASTKDEWVELTSYVNVRSAPSPTAETLRIAQKGEKLRVIARESKWVQVTDPATSETGWVSSRFTEPAESSAQ